MNEHFDSNSEPYRARNEGQQRPTDGRLNGSSQSRSQANGHAPSSAFDFWTATDLVAYRWHWLVIGGILGAAAFFVLGWLMLIKPRFTATVQLLRYETPAAGGALGGTPLSSETFAALIVSPDLLRRVGEQVDPPIPPERLIKQMKVDPQPESDIVKVYFAARDPKQAVDLANLYSHAAVSFTRDLQAKQAAEVVNNYLKKQVADMDQDIVTLQDQFRALPLSGQVTNKLAQVSGALSALNENLSTSPRPTLLTMKLSEKLQTSIAELSDLTSKYTDLHPFVREKQALIAALKEQIATASTNGGSLGMGGLTMTESGRPIFDPNIEIIQGKLRALEDARIGMATREREAALFASNPPGIVRVFAPATLKTVQTNHRRIKIGLVTLFGGAVGIGCGLFLVLLTEAFDKRLKTADDVKRVTRLPILTTLGDLNQMPERSQTQWAFRTWTLLQGRLSQSPHHGLVCGVTSSNEGEGRSTWIRLLAEAASLSGFRVLTIATKPSPTHSHIESPDALMEGTHNPSDQMNTPSEINKMVPQSGNVLATPSQVTKQLTDPNSQPVVHIPLPGWVWNLERRKEWHAAINQWREIDNLVIFVELPPASVPEAVLLGSNLPNLLWLADSGSARAEETRDQVETLRHARCNLVGAVVNREQTKSIKRHFPRWLTGFALLAAFSLSVQAQQPQPPSQLPVEPPPGEVIFVAPTESPTNYSFSVVSPEQRAAWQKRLTLGAGDVLTFGLFGEPTLTRLEVVIAPDGRVSYLEAQDVLATGLTIDELRAKVDDELGKYRRAARSVITPVAFRSKKYFVLGKVVQRGVYTLDRPITVIEALARAHGIESGQLENNTVDLADFSRSFLMREGKRFSLNFEDLFQNGDLSQNIQIEPGDFLYFPSADVKQVYVVGEVGLPGLVTYRPDLGVLGAISYRGGFNEKAYKSKVLVIRGSLNKPETFAVDTMGMTAGRLPDFKLQPKDIVYVSHRPFYRVEELLDLATTAFIQSVIAGWVGRDIVQPLTQ